MPSRGAWPVEWQEAGGRRETWGFLLPWHQNAELRGWPAAERTAGQLLASLEADGKAARVWLDGKRITGTRRREEATG